MNVSELKTDLHHMIDQITDRNILNAIKVLLAERSVSSTDWWKTISEEERKEIELGLAEAEKGEVVPHEKVMAKYKKWL